MTSNRFNFPSGNRHAYLDRIPSRMCGTLALLLCAEGCLDRPIGQTQPETQNIFVAQNKSQKIDKIDVLFMIDNSVSMADKQKVLAAAVPQLLRRLTAPDCIDPTNPAAEHETKKDPKSPCKPGFIEEFSPVNDIHIGVVTSSLGDYGGTKCDFDASSPTELARDDKGWLLGALPRTGGTLEGTYLAWSQTDADSFGTQISAKENAFRNFVTAAGETGCGFEMSLESWYRFLVDPEPPASVELALTQDGKSISTARGPLDPEILAQRSSFLRPDSLLAIVMLTDENDCSMRDSGRSLLLTGATYSGKSIPLRTGSSACTQSPNDPCCYSCGDPTPAGCTADPNCADATKTTDDQANLRCYDQKRRFGYDFLFPTSRYVNALKLKTICPSRDDLDCQCTGVDATDCTYGPTFPNPLYSADAASLAAGIQPRSDANMIFLTGIVGVPWQDIAEKNALAPDADLKYLPSSKIDWARILPDENGNPAIDPLMRESVEPRTGIHPVTQEPIGLPTAGQVKINSINHHEWYSGKIDELQYACVFDLNQPLSDETRTDGLSGAVRDCTPCTNTASGCTEPPSGCSCGNNGNITPTDTQSPLCQDPDTGNYGSIQYAAKAYPSVRQLEVLKGHNATAQDNSIVASICPKDLNWNNREKSGYGYNPAVASLIDRLKVQLNGKCLPRPLSVENGKLNCLVVEAVTSPEWSRCLDKGRELIDSSVAEVIRRKMKSDGLCDLAGSLPCSSYQFCGLKQLTDDMDPISPLTKCQNNVGFETESPVPGFCYIDEAQGIGNKDLLTTCASNMKRKLRIVGNGADKLAPAPGWTFFACSGEPYVEVVK